MATFRVGQRVRVNCPISEIHGAEVRIRRLDVFVSGDVDFSGPYTGHEVDDWNAEDKLWCVFEPHELEPIVDDGRQVITWDACCWKPDVTTKEGVS